MKNGGKNKSVAFIILFSIYYVEKSSKFKIHTAQKTKKETKHSRVTPYLHESFLIQ